jgi:amidase
MNETLFRSATDAAELVRRRAVSSPELTAALLARIDAVNPAVNAVVELRREAALQEAAAADEAIGHGALGPLHGVPMTIKESFNLVGLHTWGNSAFEDYVADADATVVRRLKQAGAIIVGKTNVHFMLADFGQTANDLYGVTNNPWDTARTPGGSTGGGAAALAAA